MWYVISGQILLLWTVHTSANVEKVIFLAPEAITIPNHQLNLDQLHLDTLTPATPSIRRHLNAAFPTESQPQGLTSWFFLDSLNPHQRHEIRVCWLATVCLFFLGQFVMPALCC